MKTDEYYFHQSPESLCKDIINNITFNPDDIVLEPFAGEDGFYKNIPEGITKHRCEIEDGLDFRDFDYEGIKPNIIITNPPFRLETDKGRKNAFYEIILYFAKIDSIKKMYILCSDYCFGSLTPKRMLKLNENNLYINGITTISVKKWRGRYYLIEFGRTKNDSFKYMMNNYE